MSLNESEEFIKSVRQFAAQHLEHEKHLPILESCFQAASNSARELNVGGNDKLSFILKVEVDTLLEIVADLNGSLLLSLKNCLYSSVEALSRVAMENTVNLIYISEDSNRGDALLKSYLLTSQARAQKWLDFAIIVKDDASESRARIFFEHLKRVKKFLPLFKDPKVKGWPDARARFKAVGLEKLYHILYAPTCNSVHSFSEDIYNQMLVEHSLPEFTEALLDSVKAEKTSFAYYLATNAIIFYVEALERLAVKFNNKLIEEKASDIKDTLLRLIGEHESVTSQYYISASDELADVEIYEEKL